MHQTARLQVRTEIRFFSSKGRSHDKAGHKHHRQKGEKKNRSSWSSHASQSNVWHVREGTVALSKHTQPD